MVDPRPASQVALTEYAWRRSVSVTRATRVSHVINFHPSIRVTKGAQVTDRVLRLASANAPKVLSDPTVLYHPHANLLIVMDMGCAMKASASVIPVGWALTAHRGCAMTATRKTANASMAHVCVS